MAEKVLKQVGGALTEVEANISSVGAGDSGKLVALDATGKIDSTMLPAASGVDSISVTVSEAAGLTAGDLVNIFDSAGPKCRLADASNGRVAHGYVAAVHADASQATVYKEGTNSNITGATPGAPQYLSGVTPGAVTETAPSTSGHIVQNVGVAFSATEMDFEPSLPITLA